MIERFPEIIQFFQNNRFTDIDLNNLLEQIDSTYQVQAEKKIAQTLVKLELIKFQMEIDASPTNREKQTSKC